MQVINRLRDADYTYKRKGERVEIWRQRGTGQRVNVTLRDYLTEDEVTVVLHQAGFKPKEIEEFLRVCIKEN